MADSERGQCREYARIGAGCKLETSALYSDFNRIRVGSRPFKAALLALLMDAALAPISLRQNRATFTTFIVLTDSPAQAKAAHNNPRSSNLRVTLDGPT
jgi:hypothetical protein